MQERIPLVIDTDMAYGSPQADIDDAVALLFALASPEFDLLAVSAAGGNAAPGCVSRNLDSLLRLVSADIPHSFSCSRPIDPGFWVNARWSSSPAKPAARSEYPDLPDSVQLLYSTLSASAEPVTLVTIGPMTNTALLLIQHPDIAGKIGRIVSMGGSGAVLLDERGAVHMLSAPQGRLVNAVGAGDSMVAGFLAGWLERKDYSHAFRLAVSAGSASAFSEYLATKEEILALYEQIQ